MRRFLGTYLAPVATILMTMSEAGMGADPTELRMGFSDNVFQDVIKSDAQAITKIYAEGVLDGIYEEEWQAKTMVFSQVTSIVEALRADEVDFLILLPMEYLEISRAVPLEVIWTVMVGEAVSYEYVLMARRDSGIGDLEHLAGRKLVMDTGGKGRIPQMWLDTMLWNSDLSGSEDFFDSIKEVGKPAQALLPIFFGEADACLIPYQTFHTMAELNPQLSEQLVVLFRSPGFCRGVLCAPPAVYEKYEPRFEDTCTSLNTGPQGRQLLTIFRVDEIVPFEPAHLEGVQELVQEYDRLKAHAGGGR